MTNEQIVQLRRNTFAGVVGNLFEWYDLAVFGFLASVLSGHFFPAQDPLAGRPPRGALATRENGGITGSRFP